MVDVSDLKDIKVITTFTSGSKAIPHNPFLGPNNKVVIAYYEDGVQIFDVSNPAKPVKTGYFDTHYQSNPTTNKGDYVGTWSVYTELPSKRIIASDMQNGLFVLDATAAYFNKVSDKDVSIHQQFKVYPNPSSDYLKVLSDNEFSDNNLIEITDFQGRKYFSAIMKSREEVISVEQIPNGAYLLEVKNNNHIINKKKIIVIHQ
jgi:Secretion system C-terminal sorting domain